MAKDVFTDEPIPSSTPQLMWRFVQELTNPKKRQESMNLAQRLVKGTDPTYKMPQMDSAGMTNAEGASSLLRQLYREGLPEVAKSDLSDLVKLFTKGMPHKALEDTPAILLAKPKTQDYLDAGLQAGRFGEGGVGGTFYPGPKTIDLVPLKGTRGMPQNVAETMAHETGHAIEERMIGKLANRYSIPYQDISELGDILYENDPYLHEGYADALAQNMLSKAGIEDKLYRPAKTYGNIGRASESAREVINRPGKNPYLILKKLLTDEIGQIYPRRPR